MSSPDAEEREGSTGNGGFTACSDCVQKSDKVPNVSKYREMLDALIRFIGEALRLSSSDITRKKATESLVFLQSCDRFFGTGQCTDVQ